MRCLIVDMALGYGAVYELRDLPKAVRRKFIPMRPSSGRLPAIRSHSRHTGSIHRVNPRAIREFRFARSVLRVPPVRALFSHVRFAHLARWLDLGDTWRDLDAIFTRDHAVRPRPPNNASAAPRALVLSSRHRNVVSSNYQLT